MPAATYVSVLVRAHLRSLTPLPKDELLALKRSIAGLGAIGRAVAQGGDVDALKREVGTLGEELAAGEARLTTVAAELDDFLARLPNTLHESVPDGADASANAEVRRIGEPRELGFAPLDHVALGEKLGLVDFESAAKLSGARFVVLTGGVARLHRALAQLMLDMHTREHGYTEAYVPYLVNDATLFGTGQLPKFAAELFTLEGENLIRYSATIEDPQVFSRPWTISMPLYRRMDPNAQILEFKCVPFVEELLYKDLELTE